MLRRIIWVIIGVPLALIVIGTVAALSLPATRHLISSWWNVPDRLQTLSDNGLLHYEQGAQDFARDVAVLLPACTHRNLHRNLLRRDSKPWSQECS